MEKIGGLQAGNIVFQKLPTKILKNFAERRICWLLYFKMTECPDYQN